VESLDFVLDPGSGELEHAARTTDAAVIATTMPRRRRGDCLIDFSLEIDRRSSGVSRSGAALFSETVLSFAETA
jgi:hypothetical protein